MTRLAPSLLGLSAVLFVAGIATSATMVVLLSVAAAAAMLVVLGLEDRHASTAASDRAPVTSGATPMPVVDDAVAVIDEPVAAPAAPASGGVAVATKAEPVTDLLTEIPGVGPAKVEALAAAFPTAADLRGASKDDLTQVTGVGPALADRIVAALR